MSKKAKEILEDEFQQSSSPATIIHTSKAWNKTRILLDHFQKEVAWHGVAERVEDGVYRISDILVYPQEVTGASVEMNTEEYAKWIGENWEDERFDHLKMQAHSHVNMGVSPSATDIHHQTEILSQLGPEDFYIFLIFNKSLHHNAWIYDKKYQTSHSTQEILFEFESDFDVKEFVEEADFLVKEIPVKIPLRKSISRKKRSFKDVPRDPYVQTLLEEFDQE